MNGWISLHEPPRVCLRHIHPSTPCLSELGRSAVLYRSVLQKEEENENEMTDARG